MTGCGAHIAELERIRIGKFSLEDADSPDEENLRAVSLSELAENFTGIAVGNADAKSFTNGRSILLEHALSLRRGLTLMNGELCVDGDEFIGFGRYAGYDYVMPEVIVPKC